MFIQINKSLSTHSSFPRSPVGMHKKPVNQSKVWVPTEDRGNQKTHKQIKNSVSTRPSFPRSPVGMHTKPVNQNKVWVPTEDRGNHKSLTAFIILLFALLISACSPNTQNNSNSAYLNISLPLSNLKSNKQKTNNKVSNIAGMPEETTSIMVYIETDTGEKIAQNDLLSTNGQLDLKVPTQTAFTLKGEIWAGEELLYEGTQNIAPLFIGEQRPIALSLDSLINIELQTPTNPAKAGQAQNFSLNMSGLKNIDVKWYVNDIEGGDETVGTIDKDGNYTAPDVPISAEVTIKALPTSAPSFSQTFVNTLVKAPTIAPVLIATSGDSTVNLQWELLENIDDYLLYRSDSENTNPKLIHTTVGNEYTNTDLKNGKTYFYYLLARNIAGETPLSIPISITPQKPESLTSPNLTATGGNGEVYLSWNNIEESTAYTIYRTNNLSELNKADVIVTTENLFYIDQNLENGKTYYYFIKAINTDSTSESSKILEVTPQHPIPPPTPIGLMATSNSNTVTLNWESVISAERYFVYRVENKSDLPQAVELVITTKPTYQDNSVKNGIEYFYAISASNTFGSSDKSSPVAAKLAPISQISAVLPLIVDDNLKACITEKNQTLVSELLILKCDNRGITSLKGLEHLIELTELELYGNAISDVSPLVSLVKLEKLDLGQYVSRAYTVLPVEYQGNIISDVSHLKYLVNLTYLSLAGNQILDINPLTELLILESLILDDNRIRDISPLTKMTSLKFLSLSENKFTDIVPLQSLVSLLKLTLDSNTISDISAISKLVSLEQLDLNLNRTSTNSAGSLDLTPLESLSSLTTLHMYRSRIKDLTSISKIISLQTLELTANFIDDISPLATLTSLKELYLWNNRITDISAVSNLTSLHTLNLYFNQIDDITPISNLQSLKTLDLRFNNIINITPLAGLISLVSLDIADNKISDISPLVSLSALKKLSICCNHGITDFNHLASLTSLTKLDISVGFLQDISFLGGLTLLKHLTLAGNQIADISPLTNLKSLEILDFHINVSINDAKTLENLTSLKSFILKDNNVNDVSSLANLTSLKELDLSDNNINDISALSNLTSLVKLNLQDNLVNDISSLMNLNSLSDLRLDRNFIADISSLTNLRSITHLNINDNKIADISILANLNKLNTLYIGNNNITDIQTLADISSLTSLSMGDNKITDFKSLTNLTLLQDLEASFTPVTNISFLGNLKSLRSLVLNDTQIVDVSELANLTALRFLNLDNNFHLSCSSVELIDQSFDGGDGDTSGLVRWFNCEP